MTQTPTAERIEAAASSIDPVFLDTPQYVSEPLSEAVGTRLVVKVETQNPIRSFKGRGTDYLLSALTDRSPLVTASAGNFGQGLAYAARRRGIPATIFAARSANALKVERMRALGAEVRLEGDDFDAAKEAARAFAAQRTARFVEDGAEPEIAEGAGTIARELTRGAEAFDVLVAPLGNGALLTGLGTWCRHISPRIRMVGVCAAAAPAMERSWRADAVVATGSAPTIADGIAVRAPVPAAVAWLRPVLDEVWLVTEEQLVEAMRLAFTHLGLVVEPAGAAGLAGCLAHRDELGAATVAVPLCGGNLTPEQAARWLR
ncbi:MAG: pyridoxal-phosphate dependent enzyme [Candidatus Dormiibacterota bacterium]